MMEAFVGFEDKIQYDILGHSGEAQKITFVDKKKPPQNNKDRLDILRVSFNAFNLIQIQLCSYFRQCMPIPNTAGQETIR